MSLDLWEVVNHLACVQRLEPQSSSRAISTQLSFQTFIYLDCFEKDLTMQSRLPSAYYPSTLASSGNGYSCFVNCLFSLVIGADLPCSVNSHFKEEFPCNFFFVFISYTKPLMQLALFCTWYEAKANFMFLAMMQTLASMSLFCISCFYSMTYFLFLLCLFV